MVPLRAMSASVPIQHQGSVLMSLWLIILLENMKMSLIWVATWDQGLYRTDPTSHWLLPLWRTDSTFHPLPCNLPLIVELAMVTGAWVSQAPRK